MLGALRSSLWAITLVCATVVLGVPAAAARADLRAVTYRGYTVEVPESWPVYRLGPSRRTCVRFDRHALYLGTPSDQQSCPAHAAGRTEAILVAPLGRWARTAGAAFPPVPDLTIFQPKGRQVLVTATWWRHRGVIERAVRRRSLPSPPSPRAARHTLRRAPLARARAAATIYTGPGFDACSAPSDHAMTAWGSSPYRAIGIYIGGINAACPPGPSNPNLTPDWVSQQVAAGWRMIPIYVGLQAPSNSCGCAGISSNQAAAQGTAAANDAVADAQSLGLPAGNPIYFDMESYGHTQSNTSAVLAFLAAWTTQLHSEGYVSGVYSSVASGVSDLVSQWGTGYAEPDDIWFAAWDGEANTSTSYIPSSEWSNHQRLHQYRGDHDETYGGVKINIDSDYLDGATADTVAAPAQVPPPALAVSPGQDGSIALRMSWPGGSGLSAWEVLGGDDPSSLAPVGSVRAKGASTLATVHSSEPYFAVQALGSGGQVLASSAPAASPAHLAIFGRSAFVSAGGTGGIPVGCYTGQPCHISTTVSYGHTTLVKTGSEYVGPNGVGFLYFTLSRVWRSRLIRDAKLPVTVTVRDASGASATMPLSLISFATSGRAPRRWTWPAHGVRILGMTSFISPRGIGGVLAACVQATPCHVTTTVSLGKSVLARTGGEWIGANELSYLTFHLGSAGSALLEKSPGNQLGVRATLAGNAVSAVAGVVLTRF